MYRANLSFTQLCEYLSFSLNHGLIAESNVKGKDVYSITAKGVEYLQIYRELIKIIKTNAYKRNTRVDP